MNAGFTANDISYTYHTLEKETLALDHISFHIEKGEFIAIVGPSGCGKSTLLNIIAGLIKQDSGTITYKDSLRIGYMLQKDYLLPWRTIYQNITLGLEINDKKKPNAFYHKKRDVDRVPPKTDTAYLNRLLKDYGLYEFKDAYPRQLSGGMRQRAALIRTLVLKPNLLLLDEPFSALDAQTRLHVSDDIGTIIRQENITTILVTHDLSEAVAMADRVIVLSARPGRIKKEIKIDLPIDHHIPSKAREAKGFNEYFQMVLKEVDSHE